MNRFEYIVESIDGDYAHLRRVDEEAGEAAQELKLVARALLPPEIVEGSRLLYEWMQYSILG
ncbi:MAG: chorismate--pyruvate lyase [Lachnospiraceae bacterium]|nr:chorismate--pyruvate lyase [Lachnospiraceae bacterium]